ncbi:hypothetical protein [Pseudomonas shirazensis]|uniref:hypothetical protein n=1 Tax=Pseudomonas shirazensis TaxID=2745494 RepID=UPI003D2804C2
MNEVIPFISRNARIDSAISKHIEALSTATPLRLPAEQTALVANYVEKIEGTYDTSRAKHDTDHAIDLLYIAYNTTPQEQGDIRIKIGSIMNELITAQQESERRIKNAIRVANRIGTTLRNCLPDWLDVKEGGDPEEIKEFVTTDLLAMANEITQSAITVRDSLTTIADRYDVIIRNTADATARSEIALSDTIQADTKLEKELVIANARRQMLDSLVADLQQQVARYERLAQEYGKQAKSAEQKSFWASLLKTGAQMLGAVLPMVALGATGGASAVVGGASMAAASGLGQQPQADGLNKDIQMKKARSELRAEQTLLKEQSDKLKSNLDDLTKRNTDAADPAKGTLHDRIKEVQADLDKAAARQAELNQELSQLEAALKAIGEHAASLSAEQRKQAGNLRDLQMQMLGKAEEYENTRREQASELVNLTALLAGQRNEKQNIELAVRSLNLSVSALKRTKEIVEEMAFFFKSFSDFMQVILDQARDQVSSYESAGNSARLRANRLAQLVRSTDEFFVSQAGQWLAVGVVSDRFAQTFKDGWSKLNKLSGTYITGDELPAYMDQASFTLKMIIEDRKNASHQRLVYLAAYRDELSA